MSFKPKHRKGKLLTLGELRELPDGTFVWVVSKDSNGQVTANWAWPFTRYIHGNDVGYDTEGGTLHDDPSQSDIYTPDSLAVQDWGAGEKTSFYKAIPIK